jgi:hypothetical protein
LDEISELLGRQLIARLISASSKRSMFGMWGGLTFVLTCFSVTVLSCSFGVTVSAWPSLGGDVEFSRVPVDLNGVGVAGARHSVVLPMCFFG